MKLEAKKYLYDIRQAVALLNEFTAGRSFADYERDAREHKGTLLNNWKNLDRRILNSGISQRPLLA